MVTGSQIAGLIRPEQVDENQEQQHDDNQRHPSRVSLGEPARRSAGAVTALVWDFGKL
jgi:hypothetical protein